MIIILGSNEQLITKDNIWWTITKYDYLDKYTVKIIYHCVSFGINIIVKQKLDKE